MQNSDDIGNMVSAAASAVVVTVFSITNSVVGMGRVPIDLSADGVFMAKCKC